MEELRKKISLRIKNSQREIILGVFRRTVREHNGLSHSGITLGCDCEYCAGLLEYVYEKRKIRDKTKYIREVINYTPFKQLLAQANGDVAHEIYTLDYSRGFMEDAAYTVEFYNKTQRVKEVQEMRNNLKKLKEIL